MSTSTHPLISSPSTTRTTYFGYGSNLWLHQMSQRCPTSRYLGVGRLSDYRWIINERGYANIVFTSTSTAPASSQGLTTSVSKESDDANNYEVYGLIFSLHPSDEACLDRNEGVPIAYTKNYLSVDFWPSPSPSDHGRVDTTEPPDKLTQMLVYIDLERTAAGRPRDEYVVRMNEGIRDAVKCGVPGGYVERVLRKWIPKDEEREGKETGSKEKEVMDLARKQAEGFRDESGVF